MHVRFALFIPLLLAVPANAGTPAAIEVTYADLNLVSVQGQTMLERRIESAIQKICSYGENRDLTLRAASQKCERAARDAARSKMQVAVQRAGSANELAATGSLPKS
jgi:UrcA family protein